jgi:hypothetical protein
MNRRLSRAIFGLFVAASAIATGGTAQSPGTSQSGAAVAQAVEIPIQCIFEKNVGACVTCCMNAVDVPTHFCGRFCKSLMLFPPPPPPEPVP